MTDSTTKLNGAVMTDEFSSHMQEKFGSAKPGEPVRQWLREAFDAGRSIERALLSASKPAALDQGYVTALVKRMQDYCDSLAPPIARGLMAEAVRAMLAAQPASGGKA